MKFNEAFNNLMDGKAITMSCGTVEYPPLMDVYFLLENHNKIIDSNGHDVTFNILQCSMDDTLEWEVYEPTKEELLFEIIELKKRAMPPSLRNNLFDGAARAHYQDTIEGRG
jgi:hypothetical protein